MQDLHIIEERIMGIAKSKKLSKNKLLEEAQLSKSIFDNMKKGSAPSIEKINVIADYLDCSVDYLLGRTDSPQAHKSQNGNLVNNATVKGDYNMNAGNINVGTPVPVSTSFQDELTNLCGKLTLVQQAKLLSLVSDVVDGKAEL